jgi:hypothetical protein
MKIHELKIGINNVHEYDELKSICEHVDAEIKDADLETISDGGGYVTIGGRNLTKVLDRVSLHTSGQIIT